MNVYSLCAILVSHDFIGYFVSSTKMYVQTFEVLLSIISIQLTKKVMEIHCFTFAKNAIFFPANP